MMRVVGRSVLERVLRARLVTQKAVMGRALSFEYLNRQLVWHELSELMLFVLPLLRVTRLKRMLQAHLPALAAALQPLAATGAPGSHSIDAQSSYGFIISRMKMLQFFGSRQFGMMLSPGRRCESRQQCSGRRWHLSGRVLRSLWCLSAAAAL